jgi:hypothetical protein
MKNECLSSSANFTALHDKSKYISSSIKIAELLTRNYWPLGRAAILMMMVVILGYKPLNDGSTNGFFEDYLWGYSIHFMAKWREAILKLHFYVSTLHYVTLRYTTLHYVTLRYTTLHYVTLRYTTIHYVTLLNTT